MPSRLLPSPTNEPVPDNPYTSAEEEGEDPVVTDVRIGDEEDHVSTGVEEKSKKKRRNKRRKTKKKTEKKADAVKYSQKAKRNAVPLTPPAPAGAGDKSKDRNLDESEGCLASAADEEEGETDSHSTVSSTDDRPPVAIHLKPRDGVRSQAAPVAAGRDKSRFVHTPHGSRDDIGSFGVYQGNWGGRRKSVSLRNHIIDDIVVKNPAHILCAQEEDKEFIRALKDPASRYKKAAVDGEDGCSRGRGESSGTQERSTMARRPRKRRLWRQDLHCCCEGIRGCGGGVGRVAQNP